MSDGKYLDEEDYYNDGIETVDDILSEILNEDGSFSEDFSDRFSAYLGEDAEEFSASADYDLSDRRGEAFSRRRVEYEDPDYHRQRVPDEYERINRRVERKLPRSVREVYSGAEKDAQRPEFTVGGSVRYPSMGVGASSERVVFDAEWEEHAKKEAARVQRVREDRSLRGDDAYVRSFVAGGRMLGQDYYDEPASPYIDPLSDDDDIYSPEYSRGANDNKNPFFPSGPAVKRNEASADGRTGRNGYGAENDEQADRVLDSFADSHERAAAAKASWMQVEEKGKKKKDKHARAEKEPKPERRKERGREKERDHGEKPVKRAEAPLPEAADFADVAGYEPLNDAPVRPRERYVPVGEGEMTLTQPKRRGRRAERPEQRAMERAQTETVELKQTVAGIVEKYNRRSEEDEIAWQKAQEERRLREEKLREERAKLREGLSDGLVMALDAEDLEPEEFGGYDDFSEEIAGEAPGQPVRRPARRKPGKKRRAEDLYVERLEPDEEEEDEDAGEELPDVPEGKQKKKDKKKKKKG